MKIPRTCSSRREEALTYPSMCGLKSASPGDVAQSSTLLYRRLAVGRCRAIPSASGVVTAGGLQIRDTAECNSAPRNPEFRDLGEAARLCWVGLHFILLSLLFLALPALAEVKEVGPIVLSVANLDRELAFYTNTLRFRLIGEDHAGGAELEKLTGLPGAHTRTATLQLGDELIQLTQFVTPAGRPIPSDSRSFDHWFQHIAIVVSDMDRAYERLRAARVKHVSTAPQTLPAWNPDAGGIKAFYFRDPEDHVLEVIWFPPGKGDPKWQRAGHAGSETGAPELFLGIDHTAIVVSDTDRSLAFYRDQLGLRVAGGAENWGVEQEHLNQVFGARLRITALRAERGPGIEFLEYITPPGGRGLPTHAKVNDLLAWRVRLSGAATDSHAIPGSVIGKTGTTSLLRDPDGHLLEIHP
jgi:catechol 2,3-dioxygenase-like lactoylglutathione lyase family enzyme